jgi:DNA-binding XRE family transcriptional regulator
MSYTNMNHLDPAEITGLRTELGWTQPVMAQYLKTNVRTVAYWEKGAVTPNEYQMAALQILRSRLVAARNEHKVDAFKIQLKEQLPSILFGVGVAALFIFLLSSDNDKK